MARHTAARAVFSILNSNVSFMLSPDPTRRVLVTMIAGSILLGSCTGQKESMDVEQAHGERTYSPSAPGEDEAPDFEAHFRSVRLIRSIAYYRQADFWTPPGLPDSLLNSHFWNEADSISTFTESSSGTATVLNVAGDQSAVVTAAHVVSFPDTVKAYHFDGSKRQGAKVIAVKVRQQTYLPGLSGAQDLELLASDQHSDIALLAQDLESGPQTEFVFPVALGSATDLEWGSFVYVLGYPTGRAMVTSGLVSEPDRDRDHSFLLDIVFNRGMSGGLVIARRRGSDRFESVGLVTSGSATRELVLIPDSDDARHSLESGEAFEGDVFAEEVRRIRYGVTVAVSIEKVQELLERTLGPRANQPTGR
jgi:hypothetical protein